MQRSKTQVRIRPSREREKLTDREKIFLARAREVVDENPQNREAHLLADAIKSLGSGFYFPFLSEFGYIPPREPMDDPRVKLEHDHITSLLPAGIDADSVPPLTVIDEATGKLCLISAHEMYKRTLDQPGYYLLDAQQDVFDHNIDQIGEAINQKNLFMACIGEGGEFLPQLLVFKEKFGIMPKCIYINDLNEESMATAEKAIRPLGIPVVKIFGNMLHKDFFKQKIFRDLRKDDADSVFMMDPTFNNLPNKKELLKNICAAFKKGTPCFFMVDCTTNYKKITSAYCTFRSEQWFVRTYLWWLRKMGLEIDPTYVTGGVTPTETENSTIRLKLKITHHKSLIGWMRMAGGQICEVTLPEREINFGSSFKLPEQLVTNMFIQSGLDVVKPLRGKAPSSDEINVVMFHCVIPETRRASLRVGDATL